MNPKKTNLRILEADFFSVDNYEDISSKYLTLENNQLSKEQLAQIHSLVSSSQLPIMLKSKDSNKLEFFLFNYGQILNFPLEERNKNGTIEYYVKVSDEDEVLFGNEKELRNQQEFITELTMVMSKETFKTVRKDYEKVRTEVFNFDEYVLIKLVGFEKIDSVEIKQLLKLSSFQIVEKVKNVGEKDEFIFFLLGLSFNEEYVYKFPLQYSESGTFVALLGNGYKNFVMVEIGNTQTGVRDGYDIALKTSIDLMENLIPESEGEIATMPESGLSLQRPVQIAKLNQN